MLLVKVIFNDHGVLRNDYSESNMDISIQVRYETISYN